MFERRPAAPDVLDVDDPAVIRREPPAPVWVDLAGLTAIKQHARPYHPSQTRGVFVDGYVAGVLWAWIRTTRGVWLGVVTMELERDGSPFVSVPRRRAGMGPEPACAGLSPAPRQDVQPGHRQAAGSAAAGLTASTQAGSGQIALPIRHAIRPGQPYDGPMGSTEKVTVSMDAGALLLGRRAAEIEGVSFSAWLSQLVLRNAWASERPALSIDEQARADATTAELDEQEAALWRGEEGHRAAG